MPQYLGNMANRGQTIFLPHMCFYIHVFASSHGALSNSAKVSHAIYFPVLSLQKDVHMQQPSSRWVCAFVLLGVKAWEDFVLGRRACLLCNIQVAM